MSTNRPEYITMSALTELDEPDFVPFDLPKGKPSIMPSVLVTTPMGNEIVDPSWCDEPTRMLSIDEVLLLVRETEKIALAERLVSGLHTRPTVRSMVAVNMPPSSRRAEPVVEIVEPVRSKRYSDRPLQLVIEESVDWLLPMEPEELV